MRVISLIDLTNHTDAQLGYLCALAMGLHGARIVNSMSFRSGRDKGAGECVYNLGKSAACFIDVRAGIAGLGERFSPTSDNANAMELDNWIADKARGLSDTQVSEREPCLLIRQWGRTAYALGDEAQANRARARAEYAIRLAVSIGTLTEEQVMEVVE